MFSHSPFAPRHPGFAKPHPGSLQATPFQGSTIQFASLLDMTVIWIGIVEFMNSSDGSTGV